MNPYFPTKKQRPPVAASGCRDVAPHKPSSLRGHNSTEISVSDLQQTSQQRSGKVVVGDDNENTATTFCGEESATEFELSVPTNQGGNDDIWEHSSLSQGSFLDQWDDSIHLGDTPSSSPKKSNVILAPRLPSKYDSDETTLSPIRTPTTKLDMKRQVASCIDFTSNQSNQDSPVPEHNNRWSDGGIQFSKSFEKMLLDRRRLNSPAHKSHALACSGDDDIEDSDDDKHDSSSSSESSESTKSNDERKPKGLGRRAMLRRLSSSDSLLQMPSTSHRRRQVSGDKSSRRGRRPVGRNYSFMKSESAREGTSDRRASANNDFPAVRVREFIELAQEDRRRKWKPRNAGST